MNETWIYDFKNEKWTKASRWLVFKTKLLNIFRRYKIIDTWKYKPIRYSDFKYYFRLSNKEYERAKNIYKKRGNISYEFYPIGGIDWGLRVRVLKTDKVIDITDYDKI